MNCVELRLRLYELLFILFEYVVAIDGLRCFLVCLMCFIVCVRLCVFCLKWYELVCVVCVSLSVLALD